MHLSKASISVVRSTLRSICMSVCAHLICIAASCNSQRSKPRISDAVPFKPQRPYDLKLHRTDPEACPDECETNLAVEFGNDFIPVSTTARILGLTRRTTRIRFVAFLVHVSWLWIQVKCSVSLSGIDLHWAHPHTELNLLPDCGAIFLTLLAAPWDDRIFAARTTPISGYSRPMPGAYWPTALPLPSASALNPSWLKDEEVSTLRAPRVVLPGPFPRVPRGCRLVLRRHSRCTAEAFAACDARCMLCVVAMFEACASPKESYMWGRYLRLHFASKLICKVRSISAKSKACNLIFHRYVRSPCGLQPPSRLGPRTSKASKLHVTTRSFPPRCHDHDHRFRCFHLR